MAQMASLLVVATVFVALWTLNIYILQSERGGGLYTRQNYLYRNLSQNCRGGLYARGGVFAGFYGNIFGEHNLDISQLVNSIHV